MDKICPECGSPLNENGMCTNVLCDYKESSDAAQPTLQEVNLRLRRRRRQMKRIDDVIACKNALIVICDELERRYGSPRCEKYALYDEVMRCIMYDHRQRYDITDWWYLIGRSSEELDCLLGGWEYDPNVYDSRIGAEVFSVRAIKAYEQAKEIASRTSYPVTVTALILDFVLFERICIFGTRRAELYTHLYEDIMHGSIDLDSIKKYWRGTCRGQEELEDLLLEDGYEVREGELSDSDYPTSMPQGYQFEEGDSEEEDCSQEISVSVLITEEEEQLLRERLKVLKLLADSEDEEKFV